MLVWEGKMNLKQASRITILVVIFIFASMLWGAAQAAPARQRANPPERVRPDQDSYSGIEDMPHLAGATPEAQPPAVDVIPAALWSRIVYQRYIDDNWEIYTAPADGTSYTRLTDDDYYDIHPHLTRGCSRIVYAREVAGVYEIYRMNADGTGVARLTVNAADDVYPTWSPDGTRIVYQSYVDGNAEIYLMNADGSNKVRLTNDADYDGMPSWSPDGTKLTFISRRTGRYLVYTMNADGSSLVQLNNQSYSENPHWSPDGSMIAYDTDSDGDGWQELWRMKADGSSQVLVMDPSGAGAYTTDAWSNGWSPDSFHLSYTNIHFIYYDGVWYWEYAKIRYVGLNSATYEFFISANTDWDVDWQTLDTQAPVSWLGPLPEHSIYKFAVSWDGYDNGAAGIKGFDVQVRDGLGGVWSDWLLKTPLKTAEFTGLGGHTYYFRVRAWDNAYNTDGYPADYESFSRVESYPPLSSMDPLPPFLRYGDVLVSWFGYDRGGSGLLNLDLQRRDSASGTWTDWITDTNAEMAFFTGQAGHTYAFRARAEDLAHNLEAWSGEEGDTQVAFYAWQIAGTAHDIREAPLGGVLTLTNPDPMFSTASDEAGYYSAYTGDILSNPAAQWNRNGFNSLPATIYGPADVYTSVYLPPIDDQVLNGGFESGSLLPNWQAAGTAKPQIATETYHSGAYASLMGELPAFATQQVLGLEAGYIDTFLDANGMLHAVWDGWDEENGSWIYYCSRTSDGDWSSTETVYLSPGFLSQASIVVDADGIVHILFVEYLAVTYNVRYISRNAHGEWSDVDEMDNVTAFYTNMAIDAAGNVHAVWSDGLSVGYAQLPRGGHWSEPQFLGEAYVQAFDLFLDDEGSANIFWSSYGIYSAHCELGTTCSEPVQITSSSEYIYVFKVAEDEAGGQHLAWLENETIFSTYTNVFYRYRAPSGEWGQVEDASVPISLYTLDMAVSQDGTAHIVVGDYIDLYYTVCRGNELCLPEMNLTQAYQMHGGEQDLAISPEGKLHLTWSYAEESSLRDIFYSYSLGDSWSQPLNVTNDEPESYLPLLVLPPDEDVVLIWFDSDDITNQILSTSLKRLTQDEEALLSQSLVIPGDLTNPTLSFLYQLSGASEMAGTGLEVVIDAASDPTTVYATSSASAGWQHAWVDLSPWANQAVTLTFRVNEAGGFVPVFCYLDEVSLGSVFTDVRALLKNVPAAGLPGDQFTIQLEYGNQSAILAEDGQLTLTLPAGLELVSASLPPARVGANLVWELGNLPPAANLQSISLTLAMNDAAAHGEMMILQAVITTTSGEVETGNNTASAEIFVGVRINLPLAAK
jgi:hypothetical protein